MKKFLIAALVLIASGTAMANNDAKKVNYQILQSFAVNFRGAEQVEWTVKKDLIKASFDWYGEKTEAFYSTEGEFLGLTRRIELQQLPSAIKRSLKMSYSNEQVVESIEFEKDGITKYYITVLSDKGKQILEAELNGTIAVYKK